MVGNMDVSEVSSVWRCVWSGYLTLWLLIEGSRVPEHEHRNRLTLQVLTKVVRLTARLDWVTKHSSKPPDFRQHLVTGCGS